jgi:hypothetical protein
MYLKGIRGHGLDVHDFGFAELVESELKPEDAFSLDRQISENKKAAIAIVCILQSVERRHQSPCKCMSGVVFVCK